MENGKDSRGPSFFRRMFAGGLRSRVPVAVAEGAGAEESLPINPDVRYEHSDINYKVVVLTGAGILLGTWISVLLLYFVFEYFVDIHKQVSAIPVSTATVPLPPEPRLQRSPTRDWQEMKAADEAQLHSYQWIDQQQGTVTIPIDHAIDLIVQRGIPPLQPPPPNMFYSPQEGSPMTGFEGKVEPEPR